MFVKDLMSWPVITIFDTSTVGEALELLRAKKIRHLPVVGTNQILVGVVSETDLIKVFPNGRELSTFESNLLARTPVSKVMKKALYIAPDKTVEEAALVMRTNRISCLPVLDENGKLIGLISKNDIIDAFITSLGLKEGGTRISLVYQRKWGFLSELVTFADKRNIRIDNIVSFDKELVLKISGKAMEFINDLRKAGYNITDVSYIEPDRLEKAE
ncbi:MAG: acetoin dehydrogenase [Firmicutes bacterium HGW-Firmicutes-14]|jgi:acetoin utilization protein AcuB|nr:MAG: acetoin dehydrogenase [Firmicutes bacterium HGW-Firmicutes-14]